MKARKSVLAGILAAAMLCQSVTVPGIFRLGQDLSRVQAAASNVALNKTATASGVESGAEQCTADKAVDGDDASQDSRWSAPRMRPVSGTEQMPQWLTLDMKAETTQVESVKIKFYLKVWSTQYRIQTSATGEEGSWEDVYVQEERADSDDKDVIDTIAASSLKKAEWKRYVRFHFEKLNGKAAGVSVSVREIEIYGTQEGSIGSAADALGAIQGLTVAKGDRRIQVPQAEGYDIKVYGSSVDQVAADDGSISPLRVGDQEVDILLQAVSKTDPSDTAKKSLRTVIPGNTDDYPELFGRVANPNLKPEILPTIQEWYGYEGDLALEEGLQIVYNDGANLGLAQVAQEMQEDLAEICGFTPEVKAGTSCRKGDIYLESLKEDTYGTGEEGYLLVTDDQGIRISSAGKTGMLYGTVTVEQILFRDGEHRRVPKGVARDYPLYAVRGIMFDVARIPTRMQFLKDYTKILKWYKLNEMQVHLNDNQWSEPAYSPDPNEWMEVEASHRLYSEYFPSLAGQDSKFQRAGDHEGRYDYYYNVHTGMKEKTGEAGELYYTKEEFKELEKNAEERGIQIVAELDTPGHSAAYTKYVYQNQEEVIKSLVEHGYLNRAEYLDGSGNVKEGASFYIHNPNNFELLAINEQSTNAQVKKNAENARIFMKALFDDYLDEDDPTFTSGTVNAGVDEYWDRSGGNAEAFRRYMNDMYALLGEEHGKEVRMWGAMEALQGSTQVNNNIIIEIWNGRGEDNAQKRIDEGFRVVNIPQLFLYTTPGRYHKDMIREEFVYYNWDPMLFDGPNGGQRILAGEPAVLGAKAAVWGDENREGITEADLNERYLRVAAMLGEKTWGGTEEDATFLSYSQTFDSLREGPGTQIANKIESKTNVVMDYDFENVSEDGKTVYDASGNGYDGKIAGGKVETKDGEAMLKFDGSTVISTPLQTLGYPYTMSFDVYLDGTEENTKESSLFSGYDGRLQIAGIDGNLSLNRDYFSQSFDYKVESGQKHRITVVGTYQVTKLYVDGEFTKILYAAASDKDNGGNIGASTWTDADNNFRTTFVFPLNTIGKDFSGYLGKIKAYNKALSVEELRDEGALEGTVDLARNRGSYADNHNTSFWGDEMRLYPAWKATDGDGHVTGATGVSVSNESRWNSSDSNEDFLMVDLGRVRTVNQVVIDWEASRYASSYEIQVSEDQQNWTTVTSVRDNTKALTTDTFATVQARYVKMQGVQRKSNEYCIYEMKVYGSVDKEELAGSVAEAETLLKKDSVRWGASGEAGAFFDAVVLAKAVRDDVMAGQEEVDSAKADLEQAAARWKGIQQKKGQLEQKVTEAEALLARKDTYEAASWARFEAAYRAAKAASGLTAEEYERLLGNLEAAVAGLVKKTGGTDPIVTKKELASPRIKAVKSTATKVKVTWEACANAASYQLYRKVGSTVTKVGAPVKGTTAYDEKPVGGKSMSYYAVALAGSQQAYTDSKPGSSKSITLPAATAKVTASWKKSKKAVTINWKKAKQATSYVIFRAEGKNGKLKKIAVVKKGTSYTDKKVKKKKTYIYKVAVVSAKKYSPLKAAKKAVKIK